MCQALSLVLNLTVTCQTQSLLSQGVQSSGEGHSGWEEAASNLPFLPSLLILFQNHRICCIVKCLKGLVWEDTISGSKGSPALQSSEQCYLRPQRTALPASTPCSRLICYLLLKCCPQGHGRSLSILDSIFAKVYLQNGSISWWNMGITLLPFLPCCEDWKSWMTINQFTGISWSEKMTMLEFPYFRTKQRKIRVPVARRNLPEILSGELLFSLTSVPSTSAVGKIVIFRVTVWHRYKKIIPTNTIHFLLFTVLTMHYIEGMFKQCFKVKRSCLLIFI